MPQNPFQYLRILLRDRVAQLQRLSIAASQYSQSAITLTPEQQHYLNRVLRLQEGDCFIALCDSSWWLAELQADRTARVIEQLPVQTELAQPITLCAALMKGQGFDEVVRAVTELGITSLVPLLSDRTLVNPSDQKLERWRRIATEAAEQSCRQSVPDIHPPISFAKALTLYSADVFQNRLICVTDADALNLVKALEKLPKLGMLILVGPEGGWTPVEQELAIAQGFMPVSLGHRVLRAVTASIAAVSVLATHIESIDFESVEFID
jgi:16S rRNA (uracil1498-N3)-methyltransferase